jgi:exopolysaccharide biosynthesis polyprenyl glycosylphosphotransferase
MTYIYKTRPASSGEGMTSPSDTAVPRQRSFDTAELLPLRAGWHYLFGVGLRAIDVLALATVLLAITLELPASLTWLGLLAGLPAAALTHGAAHAMGLYEAGTLASLRRSPALLLAAGLPAVAALAGVALLFDTIGACTRIGAASLAALVAVFVLRLSLAMWAARSIDRLVERVLLLGTAAGIGQLLRPGLVNPAQPRIAGWIAVRGDATPDKAFAFSKLGCPGPPDEGFGECGEAAIERLLSVHSAERLIIVSAGIDNAAILRVLRQLEHLPCEISLLPQGAELGEGRDPLDRDLQLVLRHAPITPAGQIAKRGLDLVSACALWLVLSPILLGIAILIRLDSPGPVLFRQARSGYRNRPFTVFKFRTLRSGAPAADGSVQVSRNDPRVTRVGAVLRRTSLDELPQLLNVLNGTMSLVGPRPHPLELDRRFHDIIERYPGRHRVPPGITGLAQVRGFRGETRSADAMVGRVECDLEYVRTRSFTGDIALLLRTCVSVVRGNNAY